MTATATRTDEHGRPETIVPDCPYCDKPATGKTVKYGGSLMHEQCYDDFGREMASAFPDELAPIDLDAFDPDWCQPEDETLNQILNLEQRRHHDDEEAGTILVDENGDTICSGGVLWDDEVPF